MVEEEKICQIIKSESDYLSRVEDEFEKNYLESITDHIDIGIAILTESQLNFSELNLGF